LACNWELERIYGVEYAEAFPYIGPGTSRAVDEHVRNHAAPMKWDCAPSAHRRLGQSIVVRFLFGNRRKEAMDPAFRPRLL
jgi:hypothetical protein